MTQSQSVPESLQESIHFLKTQPGFHRNKVPGFKEAVESILHLPLDEGFAGRLLEDLRRFQGFHIVQFGKILSLIKKICGSNLVNFQYEVEKVLHVCQPGKIAMDVTLFLEIVQDILSTEGATEKMMTSLDGKVKELDALYNELAGAGAFNLCETEEPHNFSYSLEHYHPSRTFRECYDALKPRLHQENGHVLINATVSLIRVEKDRKALGEAHSCKQGTILRAWLKLLRIPYVSNKLAILIAETERDHCNRAVEVFGNQQSNADDRCLKTGFPVILPEVVVATDKLNSQAKDPGCEGGVVFQMMCVPGSFDTDLSDWTKTTASQAQMEERWKILLKAAVWWKQFPSELTKLLLDTSLTNKDFELILRVQSNGSGTVPCVTKFLKKIDVPKEDEGEQARRRPTGFIRIFFILLSLFQGRTDIPHESISDDLVRCSEEVSAEELNVMVNGLIAVTKSGVVAPAALWKIVVQISCNAAITKKTELWDKYLNLCSSLRWDQERLILLGKALALLSSKNALLLLDQVLSGTQCVDFLCCQVILFYGVLDGDVNRHFSLMSSIIQGTAVKDKIIELLKKINIAILVLKQTHPGSIPGSVYDALVATLAGSVIVGTYRAIIDDRVSRCVTGALLRISEPTEVIALYLEVNRLLSRAWKFCLASYGQRTIMRVKQPMMSPVPILLSEAWMDTFVNGTGLLLSVNGSAAQKMSLLTRFYSAVRRDGLEEPQELQSVLECLYFSVEQSKCNEYRNYAFHLMEELLQIPNILRVIGREVTQQGVLPWPVVVPITMMSFTPLIFKKFPESVKTKETLRVYHLLSALANTTCVNLLPRIYLAVVENRSKVQDVLDELQTVTRILMNAQPEWLPLAAECLVASYRCNVKTGERKLLFRDVRKVEPGIGRNIHTPFNVCELFVRGWQRSIDLQELCNRLHSVMDRLDEDFHRCCTSIRHWDLFSKEMHWLLLETKLPPADIALCIRICVSSFDQDHAILQEDDRPWLNNPATGMKENIEFSSPIRVAYKFLVAIRRTFDEDGAKESLIETLLRSVFKRHSCMVRAISADGTPQQRSRTAKEAISDALTLLTSSTSVNQLMLWLESPCLLTCGHAMNVALGACKWRREERDTDTHESRMDINRKCKFALENAMESQTLHPACLRDTPTEFLFTMLRFNLSHKLSTKLVDLFLRNALAAIACGTIVSQWRSSEEGMKLLETFMSLWPPETCTSSNIEDDSFEYQYLLPLILHSQPNVESSEHVFCLWNQLRAQRKLEEHHHLLKAIRWNEEVSKSRIDPAVAASWLAIFHAAKLKWHEVEVVTSLTSKSADLLSAGSQYIDNCLFTSGTVNKILVDGEVDKSELKFYLTLARMLYDVLKIAQRLANEDSPHNAAVIAILQETSKNLCESAEINVVEGVGEEITSTSDQPQPRPPSKNDLYIHRHEYLKKVFIEMFGGCANAPGTDSPVLWKRSGSDSVLVLLRRWLAAIATHTKMPVLEGHMDQIFSLIVRGNFPTTDDVQRSTHSPDVVDVSSSVSTTNDPVDLLSPPLTGSSSSIRDPVEDSLTKRRTPAPETSTAQTEIAAATLQSTVGVQTCVVSSTAPGHEQLAVCGSHSPSASPSHFVDVTHDGGQATGGWTQLVQDYVVNLKDNQACIARLQSAGYNQGTADLWHDPCLKLTGAIRKRKDVRNLEEKERIHKHICKVYLVLLKEVKIESIDIDGTSFQVSELFSRDLSLEELDHQVSAVRGKLHELQDDSLQVKIGPVVQIMDERREHIKTLRGHDSVQESNKKTGKRQDGKTFIIKWENRFFKAIKLCSETIPECYAPNGFHSHKPIQCALSADSQIISVFKGREEVENVEVKLLEAGMFVYALHRGRHEMDTDELWAAFYKFLLERRLVPKIILSTWDSPAFGWAKRQISALARGSVSLCLLFGRLMPYFRLRCGGEKLDASKMKFHETVIPMEESYYDSYPSFEHETGQDVYTAALTLTPENVQCFVFSDLKLQNPSDKETKESEEKLLADGVMSALRCKLSEKFTESKDRSILIRRLGSSVPKVCGQVITQNLSASEIERSLKLGIDVTKLWKDIKETADKVGLQWFVDTIVDLIKEKRPKEDTRTL